MGVLPTTKRKVVIDPRGLNVLVYGAPGIGKSTLASEAEGAIFFATEDGVKSLEVFEYPCTSWKAVQDGYKELKEMSQDPERPFRTIVIDTIDNLIQLASLDLCKAKGWEHESEGSYGLGFGLLNKKLKECLQSLAGMRDGNGDPSYGLWMISHSQNIENEDRGRKWNQTVPSLSAGMRKTIEGFADLILFADVLWEEDSEEYVRILRTKPSRGWIAKDRTGRLPEVVRMEKGRSYGSLIEALGVDPPEDPPKKSSSSKKKGSSKKTSPSPEDSAPPDEDPVEEPTVDEEETSPPEATEESAPPEDQSEGATEPPPPLNGKNGLPPSWTIEIWKRIKATGVDREDAIEKLSSKLQEVLENPEARWESDWIKANESEIHPIHVKFMEREADKYIEFLRSG